MAVTSRQLTEIIVKWKDEYGIKAVTKEHKFQYDKILPNKRKELFPILIERLKEFGAEKMFFYIPWVQKEISSQVNPPKNQFSSGSAYKSRLRGTINDLIWAVVKVYGTDLPEQNTATEESEELPLSETIKKEDREEESKNWTEAVEQVKKPIVKREFDASRYKKEPIEDEPKLRDVLDPEMAELLGFKK